MASDKRDTFLTRAGLKNLPEAERNIVEMVYNEVDNPELSLERLHKAIKAWKLGDFEELAKNLKDPLTRILFWAKEFPEHFFMYGPEETQLEPGFRPPWRAPRVVYLKDGKVYLEPVEGGKPTLALGGHSLRALLVYLPSRGWIEVKGLLGGNFPQRIHPNSGQPLGRLDLEEGEKEKLNLGKIGVPAWLKKEKEHGQLFRGPFSSRPEYFARLSAFLSLLERKGADSSIYREIGEIYGNAIKRVHERGLSRAFRRGGVQDSGLHMGNVRIDGTVVDTPHFSQGEENQLMDLVRALEDMLASRGWRELVRGFWRAYAGEDIPQELIREFEKTRGTIISFLGSGSPEGRTELEKIAKILLEKRKLRGSAER